MTKQGPRLARAVVQWESHNTAELLNLSDKELREWFEDDYMFKDGYLIDEDQKEELVYLFSLLKSVARQVVLGVLSTEDVREMNRRLRSLFSESLRPAPALLLHGTSAGSPPEDIKWSVSAMHWTVAPADNKSFVDSQVIDAIVDVLSALAGERPYKLRLCPSPYDPSQSHGGAICRRFLLNRRGGRTRETCSSPCRKRLSRWRHRHNKKKGELPPGMGFR